MSEACVELAEKRPIQAHSELKMSFCWTPEVLRVARRLYLEVGLSASESARRLGTTRSALIAKAHRMGWADERHPSLATANLVRSGRGLATAWRPAAATPLPDATPPTPAARSRPWLEREAGECAFPVAGDGEQVRSCCAPAGPRGYCAAHTAVLYRRRSEGRAAALERVAEWVDRIEARTREPREAAV
jgi:hypothetical protein